MSIGKVTAYRQRAAPLNKGACKVCLHYYYLDIQTTIFKLLCSGSERTEYIPIGRVRSRSLPKLYVIAVIYTLLDYFYTRTRTRMIWFLESFYKKTKIRFTFFESYFSKKTKTLLTNIRCNILFCIVYPTTINNRRIHRIEFTSP